MRMGEAADPPVPPDRPVSPGRGLFAVLVIGPSMAPTLRHGDALLVRRGGRAVRPGDVVVARLPQPRPDLLVVKRAVRAAGRRLVAARRQRVDHRRLPSVRSGRCARSGRAALLAAPAEVRLPPGMTLVTGTVNRRQYAQRPCPGDPRTAPPVMRRPRVEPAGSNCSTNPGVPMSSSSVDHSDPVFDLHRGGKMAVASTVPLTSREDLSLAYTPGVARVCEAIAADPALVDDYTWVSHTVAVVTDGSAVLGLGNIGPRAAMPVMEGKAVLFKQFGGVDAVPICLDTQDVDEIIAMVTALAPVVRRDQPGGHQRPALLRDRAPAGRGAADPGLPRRPARHRHRGARRPAQRGHAARPQARRPAGGGQRRRRGRRRGDQDAGRRRGQPGRDRGLRLARHPAPGPGRTRPRSRPSWPRSPTRPAGTATSPRRCAAPTC